MWAGSLLHQFLHLQINILQLNVPTWREFSATGCLLLLCVSVDLSDLGRVETGLLLQMTGSEMGKLFKNDSIIPGFTSHKGSIQKQYSHGCYYSCKGGSLGTTAAPQKLYTSKWVFKTFERGQNFKLFSQWEITCAWL